MAQDAITVTGIERYQEALAKMQTDNPRTRKELQRIIRKAIGEARRNVSQDAGRVLDNDPRHAYKAVRNSVYRSILGGQVNILPSKKRILQENSLYDNCSITSFETLLYHLPLEQNKDFFFLFLSRK